MMMSLNDLEPEVVSLILEFIDDVSPRTTKAVACVNKYLNEVTKQIAHRHKIIDVSGSLDTEGRVVKSVRSWIQNATVLANIRTLTVKGVYEVVLGDADTESERDDDDDDDDQDGDNDHEAHPELVDESPWTPIVDLISKIGRLRHLDWNIKFPIPISVLDALEQHQKASTLRIFNFTRLVPTRRSPEEIELRLANCSALTHLRIATEPYLHIDDLQEVAFRCIVASARNLEYAGVVRRREISWKQWDILDSFAPSFYLHAKPNSSVKQLTLDGCEISKRTLDHWSSIVDLSTLQNIKFSRGMPTLDYFQHAASAMPQLKHISLNLRYIKDMPDSRDKTELIRAAEDYIKTCSPLQTLSLWSWMGVITFDDILYKHGPSLRSLQLHEREVPHVLGIREVLNAEDIHHIRDNCPNLQELTFDLNRSHARLNADNDTNKPYYKELARFKHLDFLQIYFDVGSAFLLNNATYNNTAIALGNFYSFTENSADDTEDEDEDKHANGQGAGASTNTNTNRSSSSPQGRPAKKPRVNDTLTRPSRERYLIPYAKHIWTTVFGDKVGGRRHLDVKVGDWEGAHTVGSGREESACKRYLQVRPHERDDVFEPAVRIHRKRGY